MASKPKDLEPIGKKIRKVRLEKKLTLDNMANETGLSVAYLKEVESGETRPPVGALLQISRALGIDSEFFFREQESQMENRIRAFTKRTDNYAYTTLTPGAENKHLKAFRVVIEARKAHEGVGYQHPGEEFVYVLRGLMEITVGDHVNVLEAGESLHFNSSIRHRMRNTGEQDAELLVVIYNP